MSVTPGTIVELNDLAKDYFSNVYQPLMNSEVPLKQQFAKLEGATFTGRKWIFGLKSQTGGGASNSSANKTIPQAQEGKYSHGEANLVRTYTRMALDGLVIEVTKSQQGSYRPALAETMADRLEAHDLEVNRQLFCNGDGVVANVPAGTASATQTLGSDFGQTNAGNGARHVTEGDQVQFYDSTRVTLRAGGPFTVTAVDHVAGTVTLSGAVTTTNGDVMTKATPDTDNVQAGEVNGLLVAVNTTFPGASSTFEAVPSTISRWKATVDSNAGTLRPLTDALLVKNITTMRSKSRKLPNLAITRPGVTLQYSEQFLPIRRIQGQDVQLVGGYKPVNAIQHAGGIIPVLEDLDCPGSRVFLLNTESFRMADLIGTEWFDGDGAQFLRVADKDAIEGYIRKYWQLITIQRNANCVISDINDYSTIDRQ